MRWRARLLRQKELWLRMRRMMKRPAMRRARATSRAARSRRQRRRVQKHVLALPHSVPYACLQDIVATGC